MSRLLRCPECEHQFRPDPDETRRRLPCPDCGVMLSIRSAITGHSATTARSGGRSWGLIALVIGILGLGCCGGLGTLVWVTLRPTEFPEPTEDYAEARKSFRTTLLIRGPAPQNWRKEIVPPGVTEIEYDSSGLKLKAWINAPRPGGGLKPAVLFLHGGYAFAVEDWDQCLPFREAGFVTMTPWLRGENGLPGSFSMFYDEVDDVLAAAEVLANTPGVDPNRIYVAGHSAGGTLALLAAMVSPRFQACASFAGVVDLPSFLRGNEDDAPFDPTNLLELQMRSPLAFYQSLKCPTRLYWGSQDLAYRFSTERLGEKAREAGLDVEAVQVPGDHIEMAGPAIQKAIPFFQSHK